MTVSNEKQEILNDFLVESYEGLEAVDHGLVVLEQNGHDQAVIAQVFRCVHTIKGTCGFLGFSRLEAVAHAGENLLSGLRDGTTPLSTRVVSALLCLVDVLRQRLNEIERTGSDEAPTNDELIVLLEQLAADDTAEDADQTQPRVGELLVEMGAVEPADVHAALDEQATRPEPVGEILVARGAASTQDVADALAVQQQRSANATSTSAVTDASIRVDVAVLDSLMNLVGELVLVRNHLLQEGQGVADGARSGTTQRLNLITSELQEGVMKTRMQPIGSLWGKLPRIVRDLALACGKQVVVEMDGSETELDKTIIEAIKDPLTHIVRNAVDHGIEHPAERVRQGKPPEGRLTLRAFHEGGKVNIEIRDNGAGIDPARVRQRAVDKGLVRADHAAQLSDREILNFIYAPGFSTAAAVTNVSGRGVGMDVVKTNVERIGGTIDLSSTVGVGTTMRIRIPLTLAIIPGLVVTSGGERFAIPQVNLLELVRLEHDDAQRRIEYIHDAPVFRLRNTLLPVLDLNRALGLDGATGRAVDRHAADGATNIVVLQAEHAAFGIVVDAINDTEEIVVKPLGRQLKGINAYAGATIMGDGRVALILDVPGLARRSGVLSRPAERAAADGTAATQWTMDRAQQHLLVRVGVNLRFAIPLDAITRLEEFPLARIEQTGTQAVVQYRGGVMPLVHLDRVLDGVQRAAAPASLLSVIVCEGARGPVGFVVEEILDTVNTCAPADAEARGAVCGTVIVQDRVTDILDVAALVRYATHDAHTAHTRHTPTAELAHV